MVNPVFAPGQVYELTWEDGTKPSTVVIPTLYSNKDGNMYYNGEDKKGVDNALAWFTFTSEMKPHMTINVSKAPYGTKKDCIALIDMPVEIGQTVQGVYAFQTGRGVYGKFVRTGDKAGLSSCTMKRIQ